MCLLLALPLPRPFLQPPLTVLIRQTRQTVCAIKQSIYLDVHGLKQFLKVAKTIAKPKKPKYLHQSTIWKSKTSTSNPFWILKIPTTNHSAKKVKMWEVFCRQKWPKMSLLFGIIFSHKKYVQAFKSSPNGIILPIWSPW